MPTITFQPINQSFEVDAGTKILAVALKNKIQIQYGCSALRCGTCGVRILNQTDKNLTPMDSEEKKMMESLGYNLDGSVRMACRAKIIENVCEVDLSFQTE